MMSVDILPSKERNRRRKKLRSSVEYAKSRENIPTISEIIGDNEHAKNVAEISLVLELEPTMQQVLQETVREVLPNSLAWDQLLPEQKQVITSGDFTITTESTSSHHDAIAIVSEGNVSEKLLLSRTVTETIANSLKQFK